MTDSKEPDDFARARDAFRAAAQVSDEALTSYEAAAGLLAALREMREPGEGQIEAVQKLDCGTVALPGGEHVPKRFSDLDAWAAWQTAVDELIRQGEASVSQAPAPDSL